MQKHNIRASDPKGSKKNPFSKNIIYLYVSNYTHNIHTKKTFVKNQKIQFSTLFLHTINDGMNCLAVKEFFLFFFKVSLDISVINHYCFLFFVGER